MDFRQFLKRLEEVGELKTIPEETHWSLEAAALCAMTNRVGGPALFFPKVKGYPPGYGLAGSLLTGPGSMFYRERTPWGRIALALGLDKGIAYEELMEVLIERRQHPIYPLRVSTGPCKEVVTRGHEADLFSLPFPYLYEGDGGRYGTSQVFIVKDPEMDWVNWGVYRFMLLTQDRLAVNMGPRSHIGAIYRKYERRGEPMPCCIALGVEPATLLAAASTVPAGLSEVEVAGGFNQEPIELVKAETNDLLVPARAEVILEGYIPPGERAIEGPFVDLVRRTEPQPRPVFHLTAITHRQAPILPLVAEGAKVSDSLAIRSLMASLNLTLRCRTERQFQVRWINLPVEARLGLCVVATLVPFKGYIYQLANFLLSQKLEAGFDKLLIVDADVDAVDMPWVVNELSQKTHTTHDYHVEDGAPLGPIQAYATPEEERAGLTSDFYIDATWPAEWDPAEIPVRLTFETCFPQEIQERVLLRWHSDYGFAMRPMARRIEERWMKSRETRRPEANDTRKED